MDHVAQEGQKSIGRGSGMAPSSVNGSISMSGGRKRGAGFQRRPTEAAGACIPTVITSTRQPTPQATSVGIPRDERVCGSSCCAIVASEFTRTLSLIASTVLTRYAQFGARESYNLSCSLLNDLLLREGSAGRKRSAPIFSLSGG